MVLVVPAPEECPALAPIFVFADHSTWKASAEWQAALKLKLTRSSDGPQRQRRKTQEDSSVPGGEAAAEGALAVVGLDAEAGSHSVSDGAVQVVQQAQAVVLGPDCIGAESWSAGLAQAVQECFARGGLVAAVGRACELLGIWRSPTLTAPLEEGLGIIKDSVLGVAATESDREVTLKTLVRTHLNGQEKAKGYVFSGGTGAAFYRRSTEMWVETIGGEVLEFTSIPKTSALGRLIKRTKIKQPDKKLLEKVGGPATSPFERWRSGLDVAAEWLIAASGTTVASTGAGVSAESGIPTYRDEGGLWELYDQMEVSHIKGFIRDPLKCWRFELELHQLLRARGPNAAHKALAELEKVGVLKAIITQNVDGMHTAAGSKDVVELHGSETAGICMKAGCRQRYPYEEVFRTLGWLEADGATSTSAPALPTRKRRRRAGGVYAELSDSSSKSSKSSSSSGSSSLVLKSKSSDDGSSSGKESAGPPKFAKAVEKMKAKTSCEEALARMAAGPRCLQCQEGVLKPDAVYFGEGLRKEVLRRALRLSAASKALMIIGTSGSVAPACKLPRIAKQHGGAKILEVGPQRTDLSETADILFLGSAATVLPALLKAVQDRLSEKSSPATQEQ